MRDAKSRIFHTIGHNQSESEDLISQFSSSFPEKKKIKFN